MPKGVDLEAQLVQVWRTNHSTTVFLLTQLPEALWPEQVPGAPRRTVRAIAAHLHNSRCTWVKRLTAGTEIAIPRPIDRQRATPAALLAALERSNDAVVEAIRHFLTRGGRIPGVAWLNFPPDVAHFVAYLASHEAHHRGQIVMLARALGHRLPPAVTQGLWHWTRRAKEG